MMSFRNRPEGEPAGRLGTMEISAAALGFLWLVALAGLVFRGGLTGEGGGIFPALAGVMAVIMPVAVIAMVAGTARQIRALRAEAEELRAEILRLQSGAPLRGPLRAGEEAPRPPQAALGARRPDPFRAAPPAHRPAAEPAAELPPGDATADQGPADHDHGPAGGAPAPFAAPAAAPIEPPRAPRPAPPAAPPGPEAEPLVIEDFITALNFPDSPEDAEGIRALHQALADEPTAKLIRAAQDVLTLLADDGVFMDDLPVDPAPAGTWRRLARDGRGAALGPMGALVSPQIFDRVAERMAADQVFHDAAHHFLRQFDRSLAQLAEVGGDADLLALGETRTARAFVLLGRVANSMG